MLNNPPNENQAAPGSNKILIIFLPLSTKQCGQWVTLPIYPGDAERAISPENTRGNEVNLFLGSHNQDEKEPRSH